MMLIKSNNRRFFGKIHDNQKYILTNKAKGEGVKFIIIDYGGWG